MKDIREWLNEEYVDSCINSHLRKPNKINDHCDNCDDITIHIKTISSHVNFSGYSCEHCWEYRNADNINLGDCNANT